MTGTPPWVTRSIGDLFTIRYGKALGPNQRLLTGDFPVLGSAGEMSRTNEPLTRAPSLAVGRKGAIGRIHWLPKGAWFSDTTFYLDVPDFLDGKFCFHQLRQIGLNRFDSSTATPSLRRQDLDRQEFHFPDIVEQRRIVEVLEDHLSRLDAAVGYLDVAWRLGDRLVMAAFRAFTSGADRTASRMTTLADVATWGSGGTPRAGDPRYYNGGATPWAVIGDLTDGPVTRTAASITDAALSESTAKVVPEGSVLIAMYGSIGKLGLPSIRLATNQAIAFARPGPDVHRDYLYWHLRSQRTALISAGKGLAVIR